MNKNKMRKEMTVKELKDLLNNYKDTDEIEIIVGCDGGWGTCEIYIENDLVYEEN